MEQLFVCWATIVFVPLFSGTWTPYEPSGATVVMPDETLFRYTFSDRPTCPVPAICTELPLVVVVAAGAVIVGPEKGAHISDRITSADTTAGASIAAATPSAVITSAGLFMRHTFSAYVH